MSPVNFLRSLLREWKYARGIRWLSMGYCPLCYSSPPKPDCLICGGDRRYGPQLPAVERAEWRDRWDRLHVRH